MRLIGVVIFGILFSDIIVAKPANLNEQSKVQQFGGRRSNSNAQLKVQQYGNDNSNAQTGVQQANRRSNSNMQSGVQQFGSGNSNAQTSVQQFGAHDEMQLNDDVSNSQLQNDELNDESQLLDDEVGTAQGLSRLAAARSAAVLRRCANGANGAACAQYRSAVAQRRCKKNVKYQILNMI